MPKIRVAVKKAEEASPILISGEFITLEGLLKYAGVCSTGGEAKIRINEGKFKVDGLICRQRGKKLYPGTKILGPGINAVIMAQ